MTDAEKKQYLPQIIATLKHGRISWGNRKVEILTYILFTMLMIAGEAITITFECLDFINGSCEIVELVLWIILFSIVFFALPVFFLVYLLKNGKAWKEVRTWLEDAVESGAYSYLYSASSSATAVAFVRVNIYRIKINFKIEGKHYSYLSRDYQWGSLLPDGYNAFWKKYADKEVKILYSPKYEEVMILKEPKNK